VVSDSSYFSLTHELRHTHTHVLAPPRYFQFDCCASFNHDTPGECVDLPNIGAFDPYDAACACHRGNVSIGRVNHAVMSHHWSNGTGYTQTLGGYWYSTPGDGECKGSGKPGTGLKGECTWKVAAALYKNTSCVDGALDAAVEAHYPSCFKVRPRPSVFFSSSFSPSFLIIPFWSEYPKGSRE